MFLARGGKEALEIFKNKNNEQIKKHEKEQLLRLPMDNHNVLIVILDMHLKDIPSLHVAKEITRINPQQRMIITTTSSQEALRDIAKDLGPINAIKENKKILIKPFRFSQLLLLIQTTL